LALVKDDISVIENIQKNPPEEGKVMKVTVKITEKNVSAPKNIDTSEEFQEIPLTPVNQQHIPSPPSSQQDLSTQTVPISSQSTSQRVPISIQPISEVIPIASQSTSHTIPISRPTSHTIPTSHPTGQNVPITSLPTSQTIPISSYPTGQNVPISQPTSQTVPISSYPTGQNVPISQPTSQTVPISSQPFSTAQDNLDNRSTFGRRNDLDNRSTLDRNTLDNRNNLDNRNDLDDRSTLDNRSTLPQGINIHPETVERMKDDIPPVPEGYPQTIVGSNKVLFRPPRETGPLPERIKESTANIAENLKEKLGFGETTEKN